jgi:hypothetical protein
MKKFVLPAIALLLLNVTAAFADEAAVLELPAEIHAQLEKEIAGGESLDYNLKLWLNRVVDKDYRDATHTYDAVKATVPPRMQVLVDSTFLFMLWQLDLHQSFVNQMISDLGRKDFASSPFWHAIDRTVAPKFATFIRENAIVLTPAQEAVLGKLPWEGSVTHLKAWSYLRKGGKTTEAIAKLDNDHPWKHLLELSLALDLAKNQKIKEALNLLEGAASRPHLSIDDKALLDIQVARLHFQRADLKNAEAAYKRVPNKSNLVAGAREELLWVWLRTNNVADLRGNLYALQMDRFKDVYLPELYTVKAISDLKLCQFDEVKQDFVLFLAYNRDWGKRIDEALKSPEAESPGNLNWYAAMVEKSFDLRTKESAQLEELLKESITASLPAVGKQAHWHNLKKDVGLQIVQLKSQKYAEYQLQWRNNARMLKEAIRKMQFVKVELQSQAAFGNKENPESEASEVSAEKAKENIDTAAQSNWSFPVDDTIWTDELFAAKSGAHNICL